MWCGREGYVNGKALRVKQDKKVKEQSKFLVWIQYFLLMETNKG
jgi:hypothetical protein